MTTSPSQRIPRIVASLALLVMPLTFLAAQVDFLRRYKFGIAPERYWLPQLLRIWLPGLGLTLVLGTLAFLLHRRSRRV